MPELPLNPELRPPYRRRLLLRTGQELGWWEYESENPAGHTAGGVTYDQDTYTVRLPAGRRLTLLVTEVDRLLELTTAEAILDEVKRIAGDRPA